MFTVAVTDDDGDVANASLTVHIVDDVPTARNDTDSTDKATHIATGNVMTGADTTSGAAGADTVGPTMPRSPRCSGAGGSDNAFDANGNLEVQGQFGTLTIKADGSYSLSWGAGAVGGSVDAFTYTLTDGDGDTSQATLTITNPDQNSDHRYPDAGQSRRRRQCHGISVRKGPSGAQWRAGRFRRDRRRQRHEQQRRERDQHGHDRSELADGVGSVTINGTAVTGVGQHIAGASGHADDHQL